MPPSFSINNFLEERGNCFSETNVLTPFLHGGQKARDGWPIALAGVAAFLKKKMAASKFGKYRKPKPL